MSFAKSLFTYAMFSHQAAEASEATQKLVAKRMHLEPSAVQTRWTELGKPKQRRAPAVRPLAE